MPISVFIILDFWCVPATARKRKSIWNYCKKKWSRNRIIHWHGWNWHGSFMSRSANEDALNSLKRALALNPALGAANFLAGVIYLDMGQDQQALSSLEHCRGNDEYAVECEHSRGDALHNLGRLKEAEAAYKKGLQQAGHDPQMESKLGYVEVRLGVQAGFLRMQNAIAALPLGAELHERLIKAYMAAGMLPEAAAAAEQFAATLVHPKTILRAAAIRAHLKQDEQARKIIEHGLEFFPQSVELQQVRAELAARAYAAGTGQ